MSTIISHDNTSPSRKRRKSCYVSRRYTISNLPDDVLSHILSRMPIKDSVRTCVLSKDWEFKWTLVYDLNMNSHDLFLLSMKEPKVINMVERVVHHLQNIKKIRLRFFCDGQDNLCRLATVISVILRRNIEFLQLEIYEFQDFVENQHLVLPRSLLNCPSLRKLYLVFEMLCSFKVPVKSGFPNLKSLHLQGVQILNEISNTDTLIFNFPVLEELEFIECKWVNVKFVEISSPSLRKFTSATPDEFSGNEDFDYSIKVIGATIDMLNSNGGYPENIIMTRSTVVCANLECNFDGSLHISLGECGLQVRKLLRELSNVRYLSITGMLQAIGETKLGLPLSRFTNLRRMDLSQNLNTCFDGEGLIELLHAAPFLKHLELSLDENENGLQYDYDSVEKLPSCVVHHLENVMIYYSQCRTLDYLVEKFLLKYGAHLKNVFISSLDGKFPENENEMVEKLLLFPKASTCLHISVS